MALRLSTGMRTAMMNGTAFKTLMDGGVLDIFTGSQPASADYVETGTKLARISTSAGTDSTCGLVFGTAATGVLPKSASDWKGVVSAAGVAGWFRFYGTGGTSGTSATEIRFDGNIGVSGADLEMRTTLDLNATVTVETFSVVQPAE
jgi:hypothetical protein